MCSTPNQKPVIHKKDPDYRVVFRRPRFWVAQRNSHAPSSREFDPWQDIGPRFETQAEALSNMNDRCPVKEEKKS